MVNSYKNINTNFVHETNLNTTLKKVKIKALENDSIIAIGTTPAGTDIIYTKFLTLSSDFFTLEINEPFLMQSNLFFSIFAGKFNIQIESNNFVL